MPRVCELTDAHLEQVVNLLTEGFAVPRAYWENAIERLRQHPTSTGMPKYGYGLEQDHVLVGVLLMIATSVTIEGQEHIRCNLSSWYVQPAYRHMASILAQRPLKHRQATMFNVSPARHTWPILEAQGFTRVSSGRMACMPLLSGREQRAKAHGFRSDAHYANALSPEEIAMLSDHDSYGCLTMIIETADGGCQPFIFGQQRRYGFLPVAHLVYCRDIDQFIAHAKVIGKFLRRHGYLIVLVDALGPVRGLIGRFMKDRPCYRRGKDDQIRLGDVAYSEQVLFGY
jgi:hypothetical protein